MGCCKIKSEVFPRRPMVLISGLTISVADIGYLCMSSFISVSVHELGHALAAARCISHGALINETSGERKSEAQSEKWKLKGKNRILVHLPITLVLSRLCLSIENPEFYIPYKWF
ncbi:hypothetical protein MTR67_002349 [Solanum verrucosum]|uniref:Uncharacterized protein n=1 Tax=Solanum verrucosum TaxID=315347 RepID=A0AAF0T8P3_SOLVR|nr:hypothetical protein MTR67_002349 [Solanum verrucosum]